MTNEEAIIAIRHYVREHNYLGNDWGTCEAITNAISALGKQIPVKPRFSDDIWDVSYPMKEVRCGNCNKLLGHSINNTLIDENNKNLVSTYSYCPKCGQVIDWSEKDD